MSRIISVKLRQSGSIYRFLSSQHDLNIGDYVLVEADRGTDYGQVVSLEEESQPAEIKPSTLKKVIRLMNASDMAQVKDNKAKAKRAFKICARKIRQSKLEMKLIDAEYTFDRAKIIFYFTSSKRVDFRDLVKNLARIFKVRIEMRQIGARDETKLFGGIGPCGRPLCCTSFLHKFEPVSIKMAKEQKLPLNPDKISGMCGRFMCCLGYEYKVYKELKKLFPRRGQVIDTPQGRAKVLQVDVITSKLKVEYEDGRNEVIKYNA